MIFNSILFIFVFLPIVILLYLFSPKKFHNFILLIASFVFYLVNEPKYFFIMLSTIFVSYVGTLLFSKFEKYKKFLFILTILGILSFLVYFKYFNFIINNINNILHAHITWGKIALPIGISFYTFQALSYVIDVYRGECEPQKNLYKLALFICLFPQLVAGPILKYGDIIGQINSREIEFNNITLGIKRIIMGLAKKVLLANTLGTIADSVFIQSPDIIPHGIAWLGGMVFGLQLFFDFSGYTDIAIGIGLIFGFKFMENFNYPYISKSTSESWTRTHKSLMLWIKQYLYIPLGGSRKGLLIQLSNIFIIFLICGIWHGAAWTFVIWGLYQGLFTIFEKLIDINKIQKTYNKLWHNVLYHAYYIVTLIIGLIFFRASSIQYALKYIQNMFGFLYVNPDSIKYSIEYYIGSYEILIIIIAILCATPVFKNITNIKNLYAKAFVNLWFIVLFIITASSIAADTYQPFIYFRF